MYNTAIRALERLGLADVVRQHPRAALRDERHLSAGRRRVDRASATASARSCRRGRPARLHRAGARHDPAPGRHPDPRSHGKDMLPMAGEYTGGVVRDGVRRVHRDATGRTSSSAPPRPRARSTSARLAKAAGAVAPHVHGRPPSFCTGCPERPIFAAMKLVERELGAASRQRRHRLPPVLDPAAVQHRRHDDGLRPRRRRRLGAQRQGRQARDRDHGRRRLLAQRPDQRHRQRRVQQERQRPIIVDNSYSAATGGQDILSSRRRTTTSARPATRSRRRCAASASSWVRTMTHTYDVAEMRDTLKRGADHERRRARRSSSRSPNAC